MIKRIIDPMMGIRHCKPALSVGRCRIGDGVLGGPATEAKSLPTAGPIPKVFGTLESKHHFASLELNCWRKYFSFNLPGFCFQ